MLLAHLPVLAEYCGLSPSMRAERPFCVLQAYFDDSKEDGKVLILAGYIANVEQWLGFSARWAEALTMSSPRWNVFKMSRVNLADPVQVERVRYHHRIIEEYIPSGFCVAMPLEPLAKVMDEFQIDPKYRNPYYMAWLLTLSVFRSFEKKYGWTQTVDIYFDKQSESKFVLRAWEIMVEKYEGDMKPFENTPMFRCDEKFLPLQAADLLAWWARKKWLEKNGFENDMKIFPWQENLFNGRAYLFSEMDEDGLRTHIKNNLIFPGAPGWQERL